MQKTVFIVNPVAPRYDRDLPERIRRRFPHAVVHVTQRPGHATELAEEAVCVADAEGIVVACGGDGTFREVASVVEDRARLGLVPLGTVNLIARELGIPASTPDALECLAGTETTEIFGGRCASDGREPGRLFFIGVSAGPDAEAVHWVSPRRKRLLGRYAYLSGFLAGLVRPLEGRIEIQPDPGLSHCGEVLVLRAPHYGGPYRVSEGLSLRRPGLEVIAVRCGRPSVLRFFLHVYLSRVGAAPGVERMAVDEVGIRLPPHGHYQVDGDAFSASWLRVTADRTALRVLVPREAKSD